jgi:hypothetical protein
MFIDTALNKESRSIGAQCPRGKYAQLVLAPLERGKSFGAEFYKH